MIVRIILSLLCAAGIIYFSYISVDQESIVHILPMLAMYLTLGIIIIASVVIAIQNKRGRKGLKRYFALIISLLSVAVVEWVTPHFNPDHNKEAYIRANSYTDLTSVGISLWKDQSFTFHNFGPFGGSIYRGTYQLQNDTLKLDTGDVRLFPSLTFHLKWDSAANSSRFVMIPDTSSIANAYSMYIHYIDEEDQ